MDARDLFRAELARRGVVYTVAGDGRWVVTVGGLRLLVSLDNLDRQVADDGDDAGRVRSTHNWKLRARHDRSAPYHCRR